MYKEMTWSPTNKSGDNISNCPLIDDFRNQVYSTVYSLVFVVGLSGNAFAVYVLVKTFKQRTAFNIYMLNLAVSDLLCVCTLPMRVMYYSYKGRWIFGDILCRITSYSLYVNLYCSIYFMTAMSFTRFLAIVFPVKNLKVVNVKKAKIVCAVIWIFVTLTSAPFLMSGSHVHGNKTKCFEPPSVDRKGRLKSLLIMNYLSLVLGFILPFFIILVCYTFIVRTLMKSTAAIHKKKASRRRAVHLIIIVLAAFLISFMPYHIQRTVHLHFLNQGEKNCDDIVYMQKSVVVTLCLAAANTCFDPLLYFFSGENFRRRLTISFSRKSSMSSHQVSNKRKRSLMFQENDKSDENADTTARSSRSNNNNNKN
ncbi:cysteinyl leukotriene receptor 1 [Pristis pectinata]|uniref:cysteinyl leukotriene receptor 1 n=1 Tax=Pristis pectinata TaxID=685728 RepID=UPI00223D96CD|nr:cysteinyl leukotriene receptor 1 [Pristis pectinata]XP_051877037.1 cysteinyl leukotriene receptor 1 [Pristis pectinata]XP_051877038.1 cysteinyl leukotriene receptor 1 [Pristis pectinata]XP_051877039.1 cysteinyl leukotriene receptor 1 [Pristis pectinata]XP_051877040.1 cysteinyl leukotriene receptor 1 [Pristis pectinata]XP_051877041.1 cysteinyl leukotriene receptor 1 [Pristis pectinata]XP_051877042.1 cysteinyl leukotriene receptor 1 [Pristis pectinata]XP_051877043.1 cysteinyl leukotriene re